MTLSETSSPLRLSLDAPALVANWRWLAAQSGGADCGAAIKADGYGLGAAAVMRHLAQAGCRHFFVATWIEAQALFPYLDGLSLSVLHGARREDMAVARVAPARPVLSTPAQVARWRDAGGASCDVMLDTGMNRLGLDWRGDAAGLLADLPVQTLMSHLACADEEHALNAIQRDRFAALAESVPADSYSLANSAGICLGSDYHFSLTRPGLALYGGIARPEAAAHIRAVATPQAQILQRRTVRTGDSVGYNATFTAPGPIEAAILNIGYADGYLRAWSDRGAAMADGVRLPVIGRVSMDLLIVDVSARPDLAEGDWLSLDYALPEASALTGLSQYELLTGLGARFDRIWC